MPLLGVGDSNFPVDIAVELITKTIIEFHSVDSEYEGKNNAKVLWGKPNLISNIIIVIWKRPGDTNETTNPSVKHFEYA